VINIVLWTAGFVLLALGIAQAAKPFRQMQELDRLADNARRYDAWRGGSRSSAEPGTTGADVMRQVLRRRALMWAGVAAAGVLLVVAGFAVR
jgi:hypothetical protein